MRNFIKSRSISLFFLHFALSTQCQTRIRNNNQRNIFAIILLSLLSLIVFVAVFLTWNQIYSYDIIFIPQHSTDIPDLWRSRLKFYEKHQLPHFKNLTFDDESKPFVDEENVISRSKLGSYIYSVESEKSSRQQSKRLICYYTTPRYDSNKKREVRNGGATVSESSSILKDFNPHLCSHINIGIVQIKNCTLLIDDDLIRAFMEGNSLKARNDKLKVLLWVGGADESTGFSEMVENHANRKKFISSLKATLEKFNLDGIDLDWEFPDGSSSQRIHFSQLLHEIRREYQREHSTYLLSVAVAAPATFVDMCYNVRMINENVDFVNLMTYDFHFYSKSTPYVGLNSPLYASKDEVGFFGTLNINYSVNYWVSKGLDRNKIVLGLPTYGHSFRLVNPFNTRIYAPAEGFGSVGVVGFCSYSEVCKFQKTNLKVKMEYDAQACSPYLSSGLEWISYDDERSLECKTNYAINNQLGGIMVFSINTDDYQFTCSNGNRNYSVGDNFPLLRKIHSILFRQNHTIKNGNHIDTR